MERLQPIKHALMLFVFSLAVSLTFSRNKMSGIIELSGYTTALLLMFLGASLKTEEKLKVISTIVIAGLSVSFIAMYQYFFGFQHILAYLSEKNISNAFALDYITRGRSFLPFVTPNILAGYLIMIIPLALLYKNRAWIILPLSFALLLTKSLGALFSLLFILCAYFYLRGKLNRKRLFLLLGILAIVTLVFMARAFTKREHLQPIFSTTMRLGYWKETLGIIKAHPLTGLGPGNFNLAYSRYAHNSYLQFWAETGISGIIALCWLIYAVLACGVKKTGAGNKEAYLITVLLLANSTFIIHNLIDFSFFLPEVASIWWILLGCIIAPETK